MEATRPGGRGTRRQWLAWLCLALLGVAGCGAASSPKSQGRPNIVFVLTDDLSSNLVTPEFMPHLWALEHQGATFANYFVTDSLCCPSRASIFTGRYPHDTGIWANLGPEGGYRTFQRLGDDDSTLATDLASAGYRAAMMGKYLNRYHIFDPPAPGWDVWDVADWGYPEFSYGMRQGDREVRYGGRHQPGHDNYLTDVLSRLAQGFVANTVRQHPSTPFYLEVATFAPHSPFTPAPRYAHLYPKLRYPVTPAFDAANVNPPLWLGQRKPLTSAQIRLINKDFRKRAESVKSVDDMIGALVAELKREHRFRNTYFFFSSDNGLHMGEHRLMPGKLTAFDTDIHVPLIVVGPRVPADSGIAGFAENIDLRSTFDALAGTKPSEPVDGRSLTPLLFNPSSPQSVPKGWPQGVLVEHHGPDVNPEDPDFPSSGSGNPNSYEALRLPQALYVEYQDGEREYYDLATDPYEIDNIYKSLSSSRARALRQELVRLENCHDSPKCSDITRPPP
ncbi:MAG: sulfatase family protein [Candidatus Dormibacteria bacterium]